ncbi:hypothetical protein ES705_37367 [subsurface metagenome]
MTRKFLELYEKSQYEKFSEKEKNRLKSLTERLQELGPIQLELLANIRAFKDYFYNHLWEFLNRFFVNRVRSKFLKHISQKYKELRKEQKNEKIKYLNICRVNQGNLGKNSLNPLNSKQIKKYEQLYLRNLEKLCVKYALDFKNIIIDEYGYKLLDLEKQIPLSSHFAFRLDKYIRNVTHLKRDRTLGADILGQVRLHIVQEYSILKRDAAKETSFKKVINFIREYKEFSRYVSRRFSISHIKYQQNSEELAPKSWLIENLRYMFPKKFGLPISDNLLSWFIFGDSSADGRKSKLIRTTLKDEINKHSHLAELLSIDYSANKLTKEAFSDKGIEILDKDLNILKKSVSFLIYYYVFGGYHESTYVSKTTNKNLEVGRDYFTIEYEVIRAIFFAAAEGNNEEPMNFRTISNAVGVSTGLNKHLVQGLGFGDDFVKILAYFDRLFKNRHPDSSSQIFQDAEKVLNGYRDAYRARRRELQKSRDYRTAFQGKVHKFIENFLGLKFTSEEQVRAIVKDAYVTMINDNGIKEKIHVHSSFAFDGYLELNKALKDYLGLDDKWMGIAFEAMGTYWHSLPKQIEADRKKRLICREKNIFLLEIPESLDSSAWGDEILKQFKDLT